MGLKAKVNVFAMRDCKSIAVGLIKRPARLFSGVKQILLRAT